MSKARGLGRGLGALIPEFEEIANDGRQEIPLHAIKTNPYQPRREFDPVKLAELSDSIREHGVLQPILVRRTENGYELVAGERRLRAAELAGLSKIPAVVGEFTDVAMMEIALVENLQREDLNPMEEAEAYQRLMAEFHLTQEEIAQKVGKSRSAIANALRLLNLPDGIKADLSAGRTTVGHARAILGLRDEEDREQVWREVSSGRLSVRETEELVRQRGERSVSRETSSAARPKTVDPNLKAMEDRIRLALGTKVRIHQTGKNGRIEIEYYSPEELDRILDLIAR